jgi:hypothetical protein
MNLLYVAIICVGGGPFSSAINLNNPAPPLPDNNWEKVVVDSTTIELPIPEQKSYTQTAPANYVVPIPTKRIPLYCPVHRGYSCGMTQATEDLLGHLQSEHGITLEYANEIGRDKWRQLHNDLEWALETEEKKQQVLNTGIQTQPSVQRSNCPGGNCSSRTYSRPQLFGRWR